MGKPYGQQYLEVSGSSHGTMVCGACNQPISQGEYRVAQKSANGDWHFVTHHRGCCAADPGWAKKDGAIAKQRDRNARLLEAAKAFRDKWGVDGLDELIDDLTPEPPLNLADDEDDDDYDWASPADMGAQ